MPANATTVAEIIRELWELPFVENLQRVSWLYRFFGRGGGGGDGLRWKVHYAGNASAGSYDLNDTPPAAGQQAYTRAYLAWKRNWITISIDGLLKAETAGEGGFLEAESSELSEALQDLILAIDSQLIGDGTGNSGKNITGMQAAISDSGTYATIDRTSATWWRAYVQDTTGSKLTEAKVKAHLDAVFGDASRGIREDDFVILASRADWRNLGDDIMANGASRRIETRVLEGGFTSIVVDNTPIVWVPTLPQGKAYGVSRSDWQYRVLSDFEVKPLGKTRDSDEAMITHYSQLKCRNPRRQSKLSPLTA